MVEAAVVAVVVVVVVVRIRVIVSDHNNDSNAKFVKGETLT